MSGKKIKLLGYISASLLIASPIVYSHSANQYTPPPNSIIAKLLDWIITPFSPCSLCGGYFHEPKSIRDYPTPLLYEKVPTHIAAKGPTIFSKTGESILQKEVRVTQPGRIAQADKAYIYRNNTGKITRIKLVGHVRLQEHGKLLVSNKITLHLDKNTAELNNTIYHLTQEHNRMGHNNAWGTAEKANRLSNGVITLDHATYSTCNPLRPTWQIRAKHIKLDRKKGKAVAKNATVRLGKVPVFYSPYLSFSLNHSRKSGFMFPLLANSSKSGVTVGLPYYWNMAPNYDMKITPIYFSKRGVQFNTLFRYLTENSYGSIYASYLPSDNAFERFKRDTIAGLPNDPNSALMPYIADLIKDNNDRAYFVFNNNAKLGERWTTNTRINYVTDAYYFRDFGATINEVIANQLLNQFDLNYEGTHWNFGLLVQAYETLHPIDQLTDPTVNQYMRLPELDASADYPNILPGVDFNLAMQAINFYYRSEFPPTTGALPIGQRYHMRPSVSRPFTWAAGYLTPSFSLDETSYDVRRPQSAQARHANRNTPILDIDSGLYFDRHFAWHDSDYIQTFEPRLFYLYTPYEGQDRYPVYDTQLLPFSYGQLFALNRFTGFDRLQNANQFSLGITSRFLDANDAHEFLKANIGVGYYMDRPKVCISPHCNVRNERWTPLVTELNFYPTEYWSLTGTFAWDVELSHTNNVQVDVRYSHDGRHIIGGGYTFVHAQPSSPDFNLTGFSNDSSIYKAYGAWPLSAHWSGIGYLYYNVTKKRFEKYFAGLQYDSCCVSFRLTVDRTFLGASPVDSGTKIANRYSTNYIFQLQFKGLGSAGNDNPYASIENAIPGYRDPFKY